MQLNAFRYAFIVAFGGFIFGLDAALISGTVKFITEEFSLTDLQVGTVVSAPGFGVIIALLVTGYLADILGRKRTLQIIAALYLISAASSTFAPSFGALVAARFLGGLAFTSLTLAAMYIGEIAPPHMRGKLVAMNQINIVVGLSAAYFTNYLILQNSQSDTGWASNMGMNATNTWRWMLGSEIIPALLWSILLFFIPKSPRWLVMTGKVEQAKKVLKNLIPTENINEEVANIQKGLSEDGGKTSFREQINNFFDSRLKKAVIIGLTFAIVQTTYGYQRDSVLCTNCF